MRSGISFFEMSSALSEEMRTSRPLYHHLIPTCAVCGKKVEVEVDSGFLLSTNQRQFYFRCHGKTETLLVNIEMIEAGGQLPRTVFVAEAEEKDRLRIEDKALEACGVPDPEIVRVENEDAALAACGAKP